MGQKPETLQEKFSLARKIAKRTLHDCAGVLNISTEQYLAFENGDFLLSLPQLELLTHYLGFPVAEMLNDQPLKISKLSSLTPEKRQQFIQLREKMIRTRIIAKRQEAGLELADLAGATGLPLAALQTYETSAEGIPFDHLQLLCSQLGLEMERLYAPEYNEALMSEQDDQWNQVFPEGKPGGREDDDPFQQLRAALKNIPKEDQTKVAEILLEQLKSL